MTEFAPPYDEICADLRRRAQPDGGLYGVFLGRDARPVLTMAIGEGMRHVDELFLRHLVAIVSDLDVTAVVFGIVRADGRPTRLDRRLWRELQARLADSPTRLLDVIVVGNACCWSAVSRR